MKGYSFKNVNGQYDGAMIEGLIATVDRCDPLQRLLENIEEPETCNQCGAVLKLERFSKTTISETCPNCDQTDEP